MLGTVMRGDVSPALESGQRVFRSYGDNYFQLGSERIEQAFWFYLGKTQMPWEVTSVASMQVADFKWLELEKPEVLVIGTGRRTTFPSNEVQEYIRSLHIGFECMDSRSAASTFNVLVGEGRKVATAMLLANVRD